MRTAGIYLAAAIAAAVGFYAGLWALLAIAGLEGATGALFGMATVGGSGLLAGAAAAAVGSVGIRRGVGFAVAGAAFGALAGWIVDVAGGDAGWGGAAGLLTAAVVGTAVVDERRDESSQRDS